MGPLSVERDSWIDDADYALQLRDRFTQHVKDDLTLWAHRKHVGSNALGMGEDSFHWLWKLIVDEMPRHFRFLEVGVYKGQVPSLVRLLANRTGKTADIYGVTMLTPFAGTSGRFPPHPDDDYYQCIEDLHKKFDLEMPYLIVGDSTSEAIHEQVMGLDLFDIVFVDGCHEYPYVANDLRFYPGRVKPGGYLVVDDAANNLKQPWGFFQGIQDVTQAVTTIIETSPAWEHVITVCHDRVFQRKVTKSPKRTSKHQRLLWRLG